MIKAFIVLACILSVGALGPFGAKKVATPVKPAAASKPVPAAPAKRALPTPPGKKAALPTPPAKKVAAPAPPAKQVVAAAPVKRALPTPPTKKALPTPPAKKVAAPVKLAAKPAAAPQKSFTASSGFANGLVGSDIEAGEFDPFQLSAGRSAETISWFRAAELKHGRVCMLASLGLFIQPIFHLPDEVFSSKAGYGALSQLYNERPEAIWQIVVALGLIETSSLFTNGQGEAGDLGFDPLNFKAKYADQAEAMQLRELKNGRLAMLGASGLLLQEAAAGHAPFDF